VIIFSYTSSPEVQISQKVLGELLFLTHTVYLVRLQVTETIALL